MKTVLAFLSLASIALGQNNVAVPQVGPQNGVRAPLGAIVFSPPQSSRIAGMVAAAKPGSVFYFQPGTYIDVSIAPKSGDVFVGARGAVLTSRRQQEAFYSTASNVTISNLTLTGYTAPQWFAIIQSRDGFGWRVDHCEVSGSTAGGVLVMEGATVTNCYLHDNAQENLKIDSSIFDGVPSNGQPVLVENNLITNGNLAGHYDQTVEAGGMKVFQCQNVTVESNTISGNNGHGIWFDTQTSNLVIKGNSIKNNAVYGIFLEIPGIGGSVTGNLIENNIAGVEIWDGTNIGVSLNIIRGNGDGVVLTSLPRNDQGIHWQLSNVAVSSNSISMLRYGHTGINLLGQGGTGHFAHNLYMLGGTSGFVWNSQPITQKQWLATGND